MEVTGRPVGGGQGPGATGFHSFKFLVIFSSGYLAVGGSYTRERASIALCVPAKPFPWSLISQNDLEDEVQEHDDESHDERRTRRRRRKKRRRR